MPISSGNWQSPCSIGKSRSNRKKICTGDILAHLVSWPRQSQSPALPQPRLLTNRISILRIGLCKSHPTVHPRRRKRAGHCTLRTRHLSGAYKGFPPSLHANTPVAKLTENSKSSRYNYKTLFWGRTMETCKCPIGLLWFVFGIPLYLVDVIQPGGTEKRPIEQGRCPRTFDLRIHIRPPPLLHWTLDL